LSVPNYGVTEIEAFVPMTLLHEIWMDSDDTGEELPGCCLAGRRGDAFRKLLHPHARLVHTFSASNHFEAMQIYHAFLGRDAYVTDRDDDHEPYPASWVE
jgi:hypothetical protein